MLKVHKGLKDYQTKAKHLMGLKVQQGQQERQEPKDQEVNKEVLVLQAQQGQKELQDQQDQQGHKVRQVRQDLQDHLIID